MASIFSRACNDFFFNINNNNTKGVVDVFKIKKSQTIGVSLFPNYQYWSRAFDFVREPRHVVVATDTSICLLVTFATRTTRQKQKLARGREKHCIRIPTCVQRRATRRKRTVYIGAVLYLAAKRRTAQREQQFHNSFNYRKILLFKFE